MAVKFTNDVTLSKSGFLFDHASGQTYTLNPTGQFIFRLLEQGEESERVLPQIVAEFNVSESTARKDLDDFLRQLHELGITE
ncbi:MAG: hypothetical protein MAG453_00451 [Calditrichaeota bacterium]|nr:hypothetical protein [Calditrichota bacterium]